MDERWCLAQPTIAEIDARASAVPSRTCLWLVIISITHGEALTHVAWTFKLINHGDGKVLHRNFALAIGKGQQTIFAKPEFPGALTGRKFRGRTEKAPFQDFFRIARGPGIRVRPGLRACKLRENPACPGVARQARRSVQSVPS